MREDHTELPCGVQAMEAIESSQKLHHETQLQTKLKINNSKSKKSI